MNLVKKCSYPCSKVINKTKLLCMTSKYIHFLSSPPFSSDPDPLLWKNGQNCTKLLQMAENLNCNMHTTQKPKQSKLIIFLCLHVVSQFQFKLWNQCKITFFPYKNISSINLFTSWTAFASFSVIAAHIFTKNIEKILQFSSTDRL